ncbi:GNAT family N-acetyltransferase [Pararhizobium sp.]|uniref:GNAT family N-acetyltransferase n=1 Tax=Pararhizobium sp. TaxID=1977563 RepID=UPI00272522A0|nr:N-acetyltransferase [Pararhizobium sp.]MDO9415880.1 N-acetyltransferase [Pararhizobium sp.]
MIIVRPAHEGELRLLAAIGLAAWEKAVSGLVDPASMRDSVHHSFQTFLNDRWLGVDVAESGAVVCGWAARENGDGNITDLWVDPSRQRQGIGSKLLAETESRIAGRGHAVASLETHAKNAQAISFFQKHGFAISWLSVVYSPKLDRNVETVGLSKVLIEEPPPTHGFDF